MIANVYCLIFSLGIPVTWCVLQNCQSVSFRREGRVKTDIDSKYEPFVERVRNISLLGCIQHAERGVYQWILYNKLSWTCGVSHCRSLPTTITPSTTTDYFLYVSTVPAPSSCLDIKLIVGATENGEYWLTPAAVQMLGCPTKVYCHDMASTSPREFLTLPTPNEGEYPNKSDLWCKNETNLLYNGVGQQGHYFFNKVAVQVETMTLKTDDYTFVTVTEGKTYPYGHALDCYAGSDVSCGFKGNFHINTLGTGLMLDKKLKWIGTGRLTKTPRVQRSEGGAKIDIYCGGACGGCKPDGEVTMYLNTEDVHKL